MPTDSGSLGADLWVPVCFYVSVANWLLINHLKGRTILLNTSLLSALHIILSLHPNSTLNTQSYHSYCLHKPMLCKKVWRSVVNLVLDLKGTLLRLLKETVFAYDFSDSKILTLWTREMVHRLRACVALSGNQNSGNQPSYYAFDNRL